MKLHPDHRCRWQAATPPDFGGHCHQGRYGEASAAAASSGKRRRPAAEDGVPPSLQIPPHTHILLARSPAPYSPFPPRRAHSPTAFSGPMARPARAPCSHPQTGPPDSATSPVMILYSRALCARLCVLALPPSPAGFWIWVSPSSSPPHTAHAHDNLFPLYM